MCILYIGRLAIPTEVNRKILRVLAEYEGAISTDDAVEELVDFLELFTQQ